MKERENEVPKPKKLQVVDSHPDDPPVSISEELFDAVLLNGVVLKRLPFRKDVLLLLRGV